MYETLVVTPVVLSLFVTLALELSDSRFDRRRFAWQRTAKVERPAFASQPAAESLPLLLQKAA